MHSKIQKLITFFPDKKIKSVLKIFEKTAVYTDGKGFGVIVEKNGKCVGVVTDGDIRSFILSNGDINKAVELCMNKNFIFANLTQTNHQIIKLFDEGVKNIPVLDKQKKLLKIITYNNYQDSGFSSSNIIRCKVPVRISFSGGGSDFTKLIKDESSHILSATINKYVTASILTRDDKKINIISKTLNKKYCVKNISEIKYGDSLDIVKAAIKLSRPSFGFDIEINSDVAPGTGLGGSSAVAAATIGALNFFKNDKALNLYGIADLAYQAERLELKLNGGWQDQYATVFGGFNFIEFNNEDVVVNTLKISEDTLLELEFNLLLFKLNGSRNSNIIQRTYKKNYKKNQTDSLKKMKEISNQARHALLKGNIKKFGDLLHSSWEIKKTMNNGVSNKYVNHVYEIAKKNGALGGKLLGAGQTGYMLIFSSPLHQKKIIDLLKKTGAIYEHFSFSENGLQLWKTQR